MKRICFLFAALIGLSVPSAYGQLETRGVAALGTGGGGVAFVRGNDALFFNPANLVIDDRGRRANLTFGRFSAFSGGDLFQFSFYNDAFTDGRTLTSTDVDQILTDWFGGADDELRAGLTAEVVPVAFTYRSGLWAIGAAVRSRSVTRLSINRGLFDLVLRGTGEDRTIPINGQFRIFSAGELTVGYSRHFPSQRLTLGIAPKVVFGGTFTKGEITSTATITADEIVHQFDYLVESAGPLSTDFVDGINLFQSEPFADTDFRLPLFSTNGLGFGVDLGATYALRPDVLLALSLTDLGTISWSGDAQIITPVNSEFRFSGIDFDRDRIDAEYDGDVGAYARDFLDSLASDTYSEVNRLNESFSKPLPANLHLGAAKYFRRAALNGGATFPLNGAPGNITQSPSFHVGGEYRLGPVPLRGGLRFGGRGAFTLALGMGLRTPAYDFDLSVAFTPQSDILGDGARFTIGLSMLNFYF